MSIFKLTLFKLNKTNTIMMKQFILLHLNDAIQIVANKYDKVNYADTVEAINNASLDELASSLSDALSSYFSRNEWTNLNNLIYDILYNDEANVNKMKELMIATVKFAELFK